MLLAFALLFGLIGGLFLVAYDDGIPFALLKKIRCKVGWHKINLKIGKMKVRLYYCKFCKKSRKYPVLKVIDGGSKIRNNDYRF